MQLCIKIYFIIIWSLTCFGRHTDHHQEPKIALAASGFEGVGGCWTCSWWTLSGCACFRLLMIGGVSPETCWASYKYGIINFDTLLHLVGFFRVNCTTMHGSTNIKHIFLPISNFRINRFVCVCVCVCVCEDSWKTFCVQFNWIA